MKKPSSAVQELLEQIGKTDFLNQMAAGIKASNSIASQFEHIGRISSAFAASSSATFKAALAQSNEIARLSQLHTSAFVRELRAMFKQMDDATKMMASTMAASSLAYYQLRSSDLFDKFKRRMELDDKTIEAYQACGWPISPSMSYKLRYRVIDLNSQGKSRYCSNAIIGYYARSGHSKLAEAICEWDTNQLFLPRRHIIRDAFNAHCSKLYTLSVPALLPQVEGILNEFVHLSNLSDEYGKIKAICQVAIGDPKDYSIPNWTIAKVLLYHLLNSTYEFIDFSAELDKPSGRRRTTRHTVLHGITTQYDRPIHSLRAFLVLDSLSILELST